MPEEACMAERSTFRKLLTQLKEIERDAPDRLDQPLMCLNENGVVDVVLVGDGMRFVLVHDWDE
jgi:hypothetical protein